MAAEAHRHVHVHDRGQLQQISQTAPQVARQRFRPNLQQQLQLLQVSKPHAAIAAALTLQLAALALMERPLRRSTRDLMLLQLHLLYWLQQLRLM